MRDEFYFDTSSEHQLFKELVQHLVDEHHLPPLASKLYALLILCKPKQLTFDEMVAISGSSKSSVSGQLTFLLKQGRIEYEFKDNKRKRFFKTKQDYLDKTLESHLSKIQKEIDILSKIIEYKVDKDFDKNLVDLFKNHLISEKKNILKTIEQLKQMRNTLPYHEK